MDLRFVRFGFVVISAILGSQLIGDVQGWPFWLRTFLGAAAGAVLVLVEAAIHQFRRQDNFGRWARQLAVRKGMLKARIVVARALCDELFAAWSRA